MSKFQQINIFIFLNNFYYFLNFKKLTKIFYPKTLTIFDRFIYGFL